MNMKIKNLILLPILLSVVANTTLQAGEEYTEEYILQEMGYLAKKLLDVTGKDSYTAESPQYTKPFIGICTSIDDQGILLTCVTPGTQAEKSGLRTGDIVTRINAVSFLGSKIKKTKESYHTLVKKMKTGDVLKFSLLRDGKNMTIDVTVGVMSHPSFNISIKR